MKITEQYLIKLIKEAISTGITSEQINGNQIILSVNVGNISSYNLASNAATTYIRNHMKQKYPNKIYDIPRLVPVVKNNYSNWNAIITLR